MRIGIDIDNTLTDIREVLDNAAIDYAISIGKNVNRDTLHQMHNNPTIKGVYKNAFNFTDNENAYYFTNIQSKITDAAHPREHCVEILKKLKDEGNEIIIITARSSKYYENIYTKTIEWLNSYQIPFDKLILNADDKAEICIKEKIDLFIDDNLRNCESVENAGIQVMKVRKECLDFNSYNDWSKIYEKIKNGKVVKIVRFENKYKTQAKDFINLSMFKYLNRPLAIREDVENIENFYFNRNGYFWCAIDINSEKIVGTIGIENDGDTGVMKRFYVDTDYQKTNIGRRLFRILITFTKEHTKIKTIYLNCDKRLTNARKFYSKYGFKISENPPEKMSKKPEDDVFELKIRD